MLYYNFGRKKKKTLNKKQTKKEKVIKIYDIYMVVFSALFQDQLVEVEQPCLLFAEGEVFVNSNPHLSFYVFCNSIF